MWRLPAWALLASAAWSFLLFPARRVPRVGRVLLFSDMLDDMDEPVLVPEDWSQDALDLLPTDDDDGWPAEELEDASEGLMLEQMTYAVEDEADDRELRRLLAELKAQFANATDDASKSVAESVARCEEVLAEEEASKRRTMENFTEDDYDDQVYYFASTDAGNDEIFQYTADARVALAYAATDVSEDLLASRLLGVVDEPRSPDPYFDEDDEDDDAPEGEDDDTYGKLLAESETKGKALAVDALAPEAKAAEREDDSLLVGATKRPEEDDDAKGDSSRVPFALSSSRDYSEETVAVGMDLGTTNSGGAVVTDGEARLVAALRPSVVCFVDTEIDELALVSANDDASRVALRDTENGRVYAVVGRDAELLRGGAHQSSICSRVKRILGRDSTRAEQLRVGSLSTAEVASVVLLSVPALRTRVAAMDVSAEIARQVRRDCDRFLAPKRATRCVVGVPARFDDAARAETKQAALMAGFEDVRLLTEPEAAVLAYGARRAKEIKERAREQQGSPPSEEEATTPQTILVFDLGGGTFDASVVELRESDATLLAVGGDAKLGGDDFDAALAEWLALRFYRAHGVAVKAPTARVRLLAEAERVKRELSRNTTAHAKARCLARADAVTGERARGGKPLDLDEDLDRPTFERLCRPLLHVVEDAARSVLCEAKVKHRPRRKRRGRRRRRRPSEGAPLGQGEGDPAEGKHQEDDDDDPDGVRHFERELDAVLLVGGATRMPVVGRMLRRITGLPLRKIVANNDLSLNPDEAVALGCAILANSLDQKVGQTTQQLAAPFELVDPPPRDA